MRGRALIALLAVGIVAACSPETDLGGTGRVTSALQGGVEDAAGAYPYAVALRDGGRGRLCSGVLIARNLVLTARHCVAFTTTNGVDCALTRVQSNLDPAYFTVTADKAITTESQWVGVRAIHAPKGDRLCGSDIALVILDAELPSGPIATPVLAPSPMGLTHFAPNFTAIAYGVTDPLQASGAGIRRSLANVALSCEGAAFDCTDADASVGPTEFLASRGGCGGDSGSGAFEPHSVDEKQPMVFGVLSRGPVENGECVKDVYTRTDAFRDLIIGAAVEASTIGGYPAPVWAGVVVPPKPADAGLVEAGLTDASALDQGVPLPAAAVDAESPPLPTTYAASGGCSLSSQASQAGALAWPSAVGAGCLLAALRRRRRRTSRRRVTRGRVPSCRGDCAPDRARAR